MPAEHYRPNGKLSQGYFCCNCGEPTGLYGHQQWSGEEVKGIFKFKCETNARLVEQLRAANPPHGCKPHFTIPAKVRS